MFAFHCVVLGVAAHVPQGLPYEATFGPFGPNTPPPPAVATDTEVLLFALLLVYNLRSQLDGDSLLKCWINGALKERRSSTSPTWKPPWHHTDVTHRTLVGAVKTKSKPVLEIFCASLASFKGAGRVVLAPPHGILHKYLKGIKKPARIMNASVRVAVLLEQTELRGTGLLSLDTLMIAADPGRSADAPSLTAARQIEEQRDHFESSIASMKKSHSAAIAGAVRKATGNLNAELQRIEDARAADEAQWEAERDELTDSVNDLQDNLAALEETSEAAQQFAQRTATLAEAKARELASRLRREKENRSAILQEARKSIQRHEEEAVIELIADLDDKLASARSMLRDAKTRANANEQAAARLPAALHKNCSLAARVRELETLLDEQTEANEAGAAAIAKLGQIPPLGLSKERGRPVPPPTRKVCMHMMAFMTPPSAVVPNIIAVLHYFVPFLLAGMHLPKISCIRTMREEMLFISQSLSANKIGFAQRAKQLCHDGGDIDGTAGVTISEHIVNKDGIDETVVIDALALTVGKTAELECDTIEETITKLSTNLDKWRAEVDDGDERSSVIAPSKNIGFHQLQHGGTMSDACPQALCLDALLEKKIEQAVRGQFSDAEWNAKSKEQQEDELMTYSSTCHHHVRNVGVAHAEVAVDKFMVAKLEEDLERIPFVKRITAKVRSCYVRVLGAGEIEERGRERERLRRLGRLGRL